MSTIRSILMHVVLLVLTVASAQAQDVRVMSYNIRYGTADDGDNSWSNRRELMIDQLRQQSPGVLGLQEALRFQIDEIRSALPQYGEVGIGRDGETAGEYSCILYDEREYDLLESGTFWLSDTPEKRSQDWGSACVRICTWARLEDRETGMTFYHYNTHLDHQSAEARLNGVRLITKRIAERKPGAPFVLTGDFNAAENSPPLQYLKGENDGAKTPVPMVDTFRGLHSNAEEVGTFNSFRGEKSGAKIDYIMVAPGTKVLAADIDFFQPEGRCVSDHFAVTASIRF